MTPNKFGAIRTKIDGYSFDSLAEAQRYRDLCLLVKAGEITDLRVHPKYVLQEGFEYHGRKLRPIIYESDFEYNENGMTIVEDVKGGKATQTALFKVKAKMFKKKYPDYEMRIIE